MSVVDGLADLVVPIDSLQVLPGNPRKGDVEAVAASLARFGQRKPIVVRSSDRTITAGNHTWLAAKSLGWSEIAAVVLDDDDATAGAYALADNRTAELGGYDERALLDLIRQVGDADPALLADTGWDEASVSALVDQLEASSPGSSPGSVEDQPSLAERFFIPPFDVLNAREGWWQDRKKRWVSLGIKSELGRDGRQATPGQGDFVTVGGGLADKFAAAQGYAREQESGLLMSSASGRDPTYYAQKQVAEARVGRALTVEEFEAEHYQPSTQYETGTSIFDPVLCELAYRWFSTEGMTILDPFAGGSVRGLVAGMLGRRYVGNDLRAEQIKANEEQRADFEARALVERGMVEWSVGDSAEWVDTLLPATVDLVFTCPPYLWLEKYSDDPADLSNASADDFERLYTKILTGAARALRPDRFAVVVVGDVRDPRGRLVDFRGMTIRAAEAAGLWMQSAAVLVTQVGSLAVRAGRSFSATRVLGRTHQDVLVFAKGSGSAAAKACGEVDVTDLPELADDESVA